MPNFTDYTILPRPGVENVVKRYGHFDVANREYVITRPDTPSPWHNYLTNGHFTSYVSNTGGGLCFCDDAQHRRILRTLLHSRPVDQPGRYLYLRDAVTKEIWSATWAPVYTDLKKFQYECRVGAGYNRIRSECHGIETIVTYFVAPDVNAEIWRVSVRNLTSRPRVIDLFSYAEFLLWSQPRDEDLDAAYKCTNVVKEGNCIIHQSLYDFTGDCYGWKPQYAYFSSSAAPKTFDVLMDSFIGVYRGYDRPLAVERGRCANWLNRGGHPCAAMHFPLRLKPEQTQNFAFSVGYVYNRKELHPQAQRSANVKFVDAQFKKLKTHWKTYLDQFTAHTGDEMLDTPFNTFAMVQSRTTFLLSRSISPYQLMGSRGLGFRDSNQDILGAISHAPPQESREMLASLLSVIYESGEACHTFFPAKKEGSGWHCFDDHLWPALTVNSYVKETGDLAFLKRVIPYWKSKREGTVLERLERTLQFTDRHLGKHGLPLLGFADWNDCLNAADGCESVFTASLYCAAAKAVAELYRADGDERNAQRCFKRAQTMADRINKFCWDGQWYSRLILNDGRRVGAKNSPYGKIYIESNVWAALSDAAPEQRARQALDSVRKHLGTPFGFRLLTPPFMKYAPEIGSIGVFAPGLKENGSIFCHTNPWLIAAECELGRGDKAFDALSRISPAAKDKIQWIHGSEPYVISQMIALPPNREVGRARNPWLTGGAAWFYLAMSQYILGIKPDFDGLRIDPCVPGWKQFKVSRVFRGTRYNITVHNPKRVFKGVAGLSVGDKELIGNLIPTADRGATVQVDVEMK
ncbi:MAG: glycosyl transferase [Planctomycetota bacterium]